MSLVAILEGGRRDLLDATRNISPEQGAAKLSSDCWSALECIEHVTAVEDRYLSWISNGMAILPRRNSEKEIRLFTTIRNRGTRIVTPEVFRPLGRFGTLIEAIAEFNVVRDRSVQLVRENGDALYSIGAKHPYFGNLNDAELIHLIDAHARRHVDQIREICDAFLTPQEVRI